MRPLQTAFAQSPKSVWLVISDDGIDTNSHVICYKIMSCKFLKPYALLNTYVILATTKYILKNVFARSELSGAEIGKSPEITMKKTPQIAISDPGVGKYANKYHGKSTQNRPICLELEVGEIRRF